jgi:hypothetical protein
VIDLNHWSFAFLAAVYLACLLGAGMALGAPTRRHVLPIPSPEGRIQTLPALARNPMVALPVLMWASSLVVLETWAASHFVPSVIKGVSCDSKWLPPLSCDLSFDIAAPSHAVPLPTLLLVSVAALAIWLLARNVSALPFLLFALGLVAFGALVDLIMGSPNAVRSQVLFGGVATSQLMAASALSVAALAARCWRVTAVLRLHVAYIYALGFRALGLLSFICLWPKLPSGLAVSVLVVFILLPGVASAAAIIARSPD